MAKQTKKKSRKKLKPGQEIGWQVVEEVAALLEKSLAPLAKVEHNVRLPVVGKSRRRQCDVVITYGGHPRQTVAIVEVQKRKRKPEINTFHGWYRKMQEVGAQHPICVSAQGYPQSIIDEVATRIGPTVRLLTLTQLREPKVPGLVFVSPFALHKHPHVTLETAEPEVRLESPPADKSLTFSPDDKVFTRGDSQELQSLKELINHALTSDIPYMFLERGMLEPNSYSLDITFGSAELDLWLHASGQPYKVLSLPVRLRVETTVSKIPLVVLAYQQQFIEGALAWVALARGVAEDKEISVQVVFRADRNGLLRPVAMKQQGIESLGLIVSPDKAAIEAYIARTVPR